MAREVLDNLARVSSRFDAFKFALHRGDACSSKASSPVFFSLHQNAQEYPKYEFRGSELPAQESSAILRSHLLVPLTHPRLRPALPAARESWYSINVSHVPQSPELIPLRDVTPLVLTVLRVLSASSRLLHLSVPD
jgi:hypothetical protein